jgi:WD40 repeat protein
MIAVGVDWGGSPILLLDAASGKVIREIPGKWDRGVHDLKFSDDGRYLLIREGMGSAELYSVLTGKRLAQYSGDRGKGGGLAFSPDGKLLAVAFGEGVVRVYRVPRR